MKDLYVWELEQEIGKLRTAIREHRDEIGHSNKKLYSVLPEAKSYNDILPSMQEFLTQCEIFWKENQIKKEGVS